MSSLVVKIAMKRRIFTRAQAWLSAKGLSWSPDRIVGSNDESYFHPVPHIDSIC